MQQQQEVTIAAFETVILRALFMVATTLSSRVVGQGAEDDLYVKVHTEAELHALAEDCRRISRGDTDGAAWRGLFTLTETLASGGQGPTDRVTVNILLVEPHHMMSLGAERCSTLLGRATTPDGAAVQAPRVMFEFSG